MSYLIKQSQVLSGQERDAAIAKTMQAITDTVSSTLGFAGETVSLVFDTPGATPRFTKDGMTVINHLRLNSSPIEREISYHLLDVASQVVNKVGDGTTSAIILANAIYKELSAIKSASNRLRIIEGAKRAVEDVVEILDNKKTLIKSADMLMPVASTSANNSPELGKMIADTIFKIKADGVAFVHERDQPTVTVEIQDGYYMDRGVLQPEFFNKGAYMEWDNPFVVIMHEEVTHFDKQVQPIITAWQKRCQDEGRMFPLVFMVDNMTGDARSVVIYNALNFPDRYPIGVVALPGSGKEREDYVKDIKRVLGIKREINPSKGFFPKDFKPEDFGRCLRLKSTFTESVIVNQKPVDEEYIANLRKELESLSGDHKSYYDNRISRLTNGVAFFWVGSSSYAERKELKDRVDDAVLASQSAMKGGVLPGGGRALQYAQQVMAKRKIDNTEVQDGYQAVVRALSAPIEKLLYLYFGKGEKMDAVLTECASQKEIFMGFNLKTAQVSDFYKDGILDAALAPIEALRAAVSVAATLISSSNTINVEVYGQR